MGSESLTAFSHILLDQGACTNVSKADSLTEAIYLLIKPYMQLHCAITSNCLDTYTQGITGATSYGGSGLLQMAAGAVKEGGRLMVKSMVAVMMRFFGVEHFD